jgi:shikimate dehydrogenase
MRTYGLIGFPLSHSFSQKYFTDKFKKENITACEYKNFPLEAVQPLPQWVASIPTLHGLNVTLPHKKAVIPFLTSIDLVAQEVGAVNCIHIQTIHNQQTLTGYNTDVYGFEESLNPLLKPHHQHALVLGNGGASNAVIYCLKKLHISFQLVSRKVSAGCLSYSDLSPHVVSQSTLIINTTPLGTHPNINDCPDIPYEHITGKHLLYDLTYNPAETLFLKKGKEKKATVKNGYQMLCLQAEKAWEIWNADGNS